MGDDLVVMENGDMKDVVVIDSAGLDTPPERAKENEINGSLGEWGVADDSSAPGEDSSLEVAAGSKQTEAGKKKKTGKRKGGCLDGSWRVPAGLISFEISLLEPNRSIRLR